MSKIELPEDPKARGRVVEAHLATEARRAEMGVIGRLFGGASEKPGNFAGFAVVISFVSIGGILAFMPDTDGFTRKDAVLIFVSIITLSLGYIFGRSGAS
jgi:hypothetical protein